VVVAPLQRGTLDYMPPEMFAAYEEDDVEGEGGTLKKQAVTQAVDIYSFGLVLWQLVTGGQPNKSLGSLRPPR
jgi:serine/threonine protein kinase